MSILATLKPRSMAAAIAFSVAAQASASVTVFTASDIITMSDELPSATAVAVQDGKILNVGDAEALLEKYQDTEGFFHDTSFEEKVLTPGFVEPHAHIWLFALVSNTHFITPADWQLPWGDVQGVTGQEAYLERLKALEASLPEGEPLVTWGYHHYFHGELNRDILDDISTDRPIVVWHRSVHEVMFNSAAMDKLEITRKSWTGEGEGYTMLDWDKGHAWEKGLYLTAPALFQLIATPKKFAQGMNRAYDYFQAGGITTVVDPGMMLPEDMARGMISILESRDSMLDYLMIPAGNTIFDHNDKDPEKTLAIAKEMVNNPEMNGTHVRWLPSQIKLFSDGAAYSQLMHMKDGYLDGHEGEWIQYPEDLEASMRPFWKDGYTVVVHANGDLGLEVAVDIMETLNKEKARDDHRTSFHHLAYTDPVDIQRAADMGANFSVNPFYLHVLGEQYSLYGVGPERSEVMARGRSFLDAGAVLSFHSDAPMAPGRPLALSWTAVNRTGLSGRKMGAEEKLTMEEAMRAITIDAAYVSRQENEIGSIEVGKRANFAVLKQHPYKVAPEDIKDIEVWGTVFDGKTFPVENASAGLVLTPSNINKLSAISHHHQHHPLYPVEHTHSDICEINIMLQEVMSTM